MLVVFIAFFNFIIFVFIAIIVGRNLINITKNFSSSVRNTYESKIENKNDAFVYEDVSNIESTSFNSTMKSNNNPIKEKRGKRSNI